MFPSVPKNCEQSTSSQNYTLVKSKDLKKLPSNELYKIIFLYDREVAILNDQLESLDLNLKEKSLEILELTEQISFLRENNKIISSEMFRYYQLAEAYKKLDTKHIPQSEKNTKLSNFSDNVKAKTNIEVEKLKHENEILLEKLQTAKTKVQDMVKENTELQDNNDRLKLSKESMMFELSTVKECLNNKNSVLREALKLTQEKCNRKDLKIKKLKEILQDKSNPQEEIKNKNGNLKYKTHNNSEFTNNNTKVFQRVANTQDYEELKQKHLQSIEENNELAKKVSDLTVKLETARKEVLMMHQRLKQESEPSTPSSAHTDSVWSIKTQIDRIYREFIYEINTNPNGNSGMFSNIEGRLSELVSMFNQTLQEREDGSPRFLLQNEEAQRTKKTDFGSICSTIDWNSPKTTSSVRF